MTDAGENPSEHVDHRRVALVPMRSKGETLGEFHGSNDLKKAMEVRLSDEESYPLRREMVYCFFDIPAVEAARIMCVSLSVLKKIRTWVKVERGPCFLIHSGDFEGLTRAQVVQGRDEVISELEKECAMLAKSEESCRRSGRSIKKHKSNKSRNVEAGVVYGYKGITLALKILKEVREYAALYLCLLIPDGGRRQSIKPVVKGGDLEEEMGSSMHSTRDSTEHDSKEETPPGDSVKLPKRVRKIVEQMQPRQVVQRKARVSVKTIVEPEDCFWPVSITQEFNFDRLFESNDVEDELRLGPVTVSTNVSTAVALERGHEHGQTTHSASAGSDEEDFGFLGK
jgi:hypothetical protein